MNKDRIDITLGIRTGKLILQTIESLIEIKKKSDPYYTKSRFVREAIIEKIQREK